MPPSTLPRSVPLLKPARFCRGYFHGKRGTHCLLGWRYTFFMDYPALSLAIDRALYEEVKARDEMAVGVGSFNDDPRNSKRTLAEIWRDALVRVGYAVRGGKLVLPTKKGK